MNTSGWELEYIKEAQGCFEKHGVEGIVDFCKTKRESWKDVEINIGITGNSGAGKSSFINAIRGLGDEDDGAAEIGITETTTMPTVYPHLTSDKIKFWDLPGVGTPNYPDFQTYSEKVKLKKYDFFLILTTKRFTENDRLLAEKVKSLKKSFFFIRTHVDVDYGNERRKKFFDEQKMLRKIKEDCWKNLQDLQADEVFLISNIYPRKWDFGRLTQAIHDVLPRHQKECLTLALRSLSTDMLKQKADLLRGRIWMIASASAVAAAIPIPGLNIVVDEALLTNEVSFYKSQLGLPDEKSVEFQRMTPENQQKVRKFSIITTALRMAEPLWKFSTLSPAKEFARFIPIVGAAVAGGISFTANYYFLHYCVNELESAAQDFMKEITSRKDDFKPEIKMETAQQSNSESSLRTPAKPVVNCNIPKTSTPVNELKTTEKGESDDLKKMTSKKVNDFEPEINMKTKQHSSMRAAQQSNKSSLCTPAKPVENNIPKPSTREINKLKIKEKGKGDDLKELQSMLSVVMTKLEKLDHTEIKLKDKKSKSTTTAAEMSKLRSEAIKQVKDLFKLKEMGAITKDEFAKKKKDLLKYWI